jgi:type IV pilus assembly protein PilW
MYALSTSFAHGARRMTSMRSAARQRGLSIIELMIGIVVSLLVGLAAAGSAMVFTASQRQGIGVGGSLVNVGTVITALKNDSANAGLGFFGDDVFLCNSLNLSIGGTLIADSASFAPLRITQGASSDSIDVVYSTQVHSGANVLLNAASPSSTSAELMSLLPVSVGQAVLLAPPTPAAGTACTVRTVSAVTPSTEDTRQVLAFAAAAKHNAAAFTNLATLNYPERSRVALLGELRWNNYSVDANGNLLLTRPIDGGTPAVLARNVMSFRAQYGITDAVATSTTIEDWQSASVAPFIALDSAAIGRVRALRIGIVTRSPQREKPNTAGVCEASTAVPQLFGVDAFDVSAFPDWQCFRFRSTTAVLPLRNVVLGIKK